MESTGRTSHRAPSTCMMPSTCRIPVVHRRLEAAHRAWHTARDGYNDPNNFTFGLNSCIQELRNVTFALQSALRNKVEGFDEWYAPWSQTLRSDDVCKWASNARTEITKVGDLNSRSTLRVWHLFTYDDVASFRQYKVNGADYSNYAIEPLLSAAEVVENDKLASGNSPRVQALGMERRWTVPEIPEWELLDALSHCYGVLAKLVIDCEASLIAPLSGRNYSAFAEQITAKTTTPNCMRAKETDRLELVSPKTGLASAHRTTRLERDDSTLPELVERYGPLRVLPKDVSSPLDLVLPQFNNAKRVLAADGYHLRIQMLYRGTTIVHNEAVELGDRTDKYMHSLRLAELATRLGADGFFEIAEAWYASAHSATADPYGEISDREDRREILFVTAFTRREGVLSRWCFFNRTAFGITFEEDRSDTLAWNHLKPLAQSWGVGFEATI